MLFYLYEICIVNRFFGYSITYDEVGNPLTYRGNTLTWTFGRRLASFGNISYTYNEDGIRTKKIIGNKTTEFYLDGSNIIRQSDGTDTLYFFYDRDDNLTGFEYDGDVYFYVKNMQGDTVAISDDSGNVVAEYTYDPWGKVLSVTGTNSALGNLNPFRYRGYYYDTDTSLYYLQSRYYDPETGRFLNSDDVNFIGTTESEISYNPFAYCENDPVNNVDPTGNWWFKINKGFTIAVGVIGLLYRMYSIIKDIRSIYNMTKSKLATLLYTAIPYASMYVSTEAIGYLIKGAVLTSLVSTMFGFVSSWFTGGLSWAVKTVLNFLCSYFAPSISTSIKMIYYGIRYGSRALIDYRIWYIGYWI